MKKTLRWSILLSLLLVCLMIPVMAQSADAEELWVGDTEVDLTAASSGSGWTYDPDSKTLTLNDAVIDEPGTSTNVAALIYAKDFDELTITGSAELSASANNAMYGIYAASVDTLRFVDAEIQAEGEGAGIEADRLIVIEGDNTKLTAGGSTGTGIICASLSVKAGILNAGGSSCGIEAGSITISGGTVTAEGTQALGTAPVLDGMFAVTVEYTEEWDGTTDLTTYSYVKIEKTVATYPLWVGGKQVDSDNLTDILGDGGKAQFAPKTNTLTLTGADITGEYNNTAIYSELTDELTITGSGSVTGSGYGIYAVKDLAITAGSKVTATSMAKDSSSSLDSGAIYSKEGKITITEAEVTAEVTGEYGVAIYADADAGDITITGGKVTAKSVSEGTGIRGEGKVAITNAEVIANGGKNQGIFAGKGLTITGSTVKAKGSSAGIWSVEGDLVIDNAEVTAEGDDYGFSTSKGNINISGKDTKVTADALTAFKAGGGSITISSPLVILEPNDGVVKTYNDGKIQTIYESDETTIANHVVIEAGTYYDLWVGGVRVNSVNKGDILGDGTGSAKFDPTTNTLTLNNPKIAGTHEDAQIYSKGIDLTIQGDAELTLSGALMGILTEDGDLTITGGTLTAEGSKWGIRAFTSGIAYSKITVSGGTVRAKGGDSSSYDYNGIAAEAIYIIDGTVFAEGRHGMSAAVLIEISGGQVTAEGSSEGVGIYAYGGNLRITGGHVSAVSNGTKETIAAKYDLEISGEDTVVESLNKQGAAALRSNFGTISIADPLVILEPNDGAVGEKNGKKVVLKSDGTTAADHVIIKKGEYYDLWVGGVRVNSENKGDILGDGKAEFDPEKNTLTLTGADITGEYKNAAIYSELTDELTITGSGSVTGSGYGIYAENDLAITDGAEVTATAAEKNGCAIYAENGDITISGAKVTATAPSGVSENDGKYSDAIHAERGDILISNAEVNASATGEDGRGIRVQRSGNITISDSTIEIEAKNAGIFGTYTSVITIKDNSKLHIKTRYGITTYVTSTPEGMMPGDVSIEDSSVIIENCYYGIYGKYVTVSGGTVTATASTNGFDVKKSLKISDGAVVTATAKGNGSLSEGIDCAGEVIISGAETVVKAYGDNSAIRAGGGITITSPLAILEPNDGKLDAYKTNVCESDGTTVAKNAYIAKGYLVTWQNDDGTVLQSYAVGVGETPVYTGPTPTKEASGGYSYTFDGWTPEITAVTAEATYTATYKKTADGTSSGGGVLVVDPETGEPVVGGSAKLIDPETGEVLDEWVPDGKPHPLPGDLPPGEYKIVVELPDGTTVETTIVVGEDGSVSIVGSDGTLTPVAPGGVIPVYGSVKKFTITWRNYDGSILEVDTEVPYGTTPAYNGAAPTRPATSSYSFIFNGWTPSVAPVTKNIDYTASFTAVPVFGPGIPGTLFPVMPGYLPGFTPGGTPGTTPGGTPGTEPGTPGVDSGSNGGSVINPETGLPFTDVTPDSPYLEDIQFVYENDLMIGMSDTEFGEYLPLTRGMIVTILHRMEGKPEVAYTGVFTDVPDGEWFTDGVEWAASHGIVLGYGDGRYGPNDFVTREQLAAILFRYANWKGYDTSIGEDTNILSYDDAFTWGDWAVSALQWACGTGVLEDVPVGMLRPTDDATRGEIAHAIRIFCEEVAK